MKQLSKIIAAGLVCLVSTGAVLAGSSEECVTRKFKDVFTPMDPSFAAVVAEANAIADSQPLRPGLQAERARVKGGAEFVRVEVISTSCTTDQKAEPVAATAKCLTLLCETNFPGANAPLGSTMVIESCVAGINTKATYTRVSSGGSLVWRLTDLHESELGTCPRLKQPGMGGQ